MISTPSRPSLSGHSTPFRAALASAIRTQIQMMRRAGDTSASVECLRQLVRSPSHSLAGAPAGTNSQFYYGQMFAEVCEQDRTIRSFVHA